MASKKPRLPWQHTQDKHGYQSWSLCPKIFPPLLISEWEENGERRIKREIETSKSYHVTLWGRGAGEYSSPLAALHGAEDTLRSKCRDLLKFLGQKRKTST